MTNRTGPPEKQPALSADELAEQAGEALPDREAMSVFARFGGGIDNFAMPINEAIAINNESVESYAIADADQVVILNQVDDDATAD